MTIKLTVAESGPVYSTVLATVDGDKAEIRVFDNGDWQLVSADGRAADITDWTFAAEVGL